MVVETVTILYYSLGAISFCLVLCQKYNEQIQVCINKWIYNYDLVNSDENMEENDLGLNNVLNNPEETYILFNEMTNINTNDDNELSDNKIKTKKNVIIDFE